jgi:hypothetical protein
VPSSSLPDFALYIQKQRKFMVLVIGLVPAVCKAKIERTRLEFRERYNYDEQLS